MSGAPFFMGLLGLASCVGVFGGMNIYLYISCTGTVYSLHIHYTFLLDVLQR